MLLLCGHVTLLGYVIVRMPGLAEVCIEFRDGYGGAAMQGYIVAATTSCGTTVITEEEC
jgi:hypothetical protein